MIVLYHRTVSTWFGKVMLLLFCSDYVSSHDFEGKSKLSFFHPTPNSQVRWLPKSKGSLVLGQGFGMLVIESTASLRSSKFFFLKASLFLIFYCWSTSSAAPSEIDKIRHQLKIPAHLRSQPVRWSCKAHKHQSVATHYSHKAIRRAASTLLSPMNLGGLSAGWCLSASGNLKKFIRGWPNWIRTLAPLAWCCIITDWQHSLGFRDWLFPAIFMYHKNHIRIKGSSEFKAHALPLDFDPSLNTSLSTPSGVLCSYFCSKG